MRCKFVISDNFYHYTARKLHLLRNLIRIVKRLTENVLATVLREADLLVAADLDLLDECLDRLLYLKLLLCLSLYRGRMGH